MGPLALLLLQGGVAILAILAMWGIAKRRMGVAWSAIGWGALAFPLSQLARFALVVPLNILLDRLLDPAAAAVAVTAVMLVSSGLFEETTRWVVMRYWAKNVRQWRDGIGFGLGHGSIEAILLLGNAVLSNIALLQFSDVVLTQVGAAGDAEATAAVQQQIEAVENLSFGLVALTWYERALAITFHVAMSLLVLRAVRERTWQLWLLAVVAHVAFNAVVVLAMPLGYGATYALMTVCTAVAVWAIAAGPLSRKQLGGAPRYP